jgi:hypothetical protein
MLYALQANRKSNSDNQDSQLSKRVLFVLVTAITVAILVPLSIAHMTHPYMIYHILLHISGVIIATFLSVVSTLAYQRTASLKVLLMTIGFASLVAVEVLYVLDLSIPMISSMHLFDIPITNIELPHVLLLIMLVTFSTGVLKMN